MKNLKRKFIKLLGFSLISTFLFPFNILFAIKKKIINPNLSEEQKKKLEDIGFVVVVPLGTRYEDQRV